MGNSDELVFGLSLPFSLYLPLAERIVEAIEGAYIIFGSSGAAYDDFAAGDVFDVALFTTGVSETVRTVVISCRGAAARVDERCSCPALAAKVPLE